MSPLTTTDAEALAAVLERRLDGFTELLEASDYSVSMSQLLDARRAAGAGLFAGRREWMHALRSIFCQSATQWSGFERLYYMYWADFSTVDDDSNHSADDHQEESGGPDSAREQGQRALVGFAGTSSEQRVDELGAGDFRALSLADFRFVKDAAMKQAIQHHIDRLARRARRQRMRRYRDADKGRRLSLRATLRASHASQGRLFNLRYRQRRRRLPPLVLLVDISQSMDVYARLFLRFICQLMRLFDQSSAFAFNIRLVTLPDAHRGLTEAEFESALNDSASGWLGGTRIAESLRAFNEQHLHDLVRSVTTVVVFSDGADTARSEELINELQPLQRAAKRLVWVNPLLGRSAPGKPNLYMDPLQPYIDHYVSSRTLDGLEELCDILTDQRHIERPVRMGAGNQSRAAL